MMFYRPLAIAIVRDCLRCTESAANEGGPCSVELFATRRCSPQHAVGVFLNYLSINAYHNVEDTVLISRQR